MVKADVAKVEEQIRNAGLTKGIRPSEFFLDFDKLRTGFVTTTQFHRVIWENFGMTLSPEEVEVMSEKYDFKRDGHMNYRRFLNVINLAFDANQLDTDPRCQKLEPREYLGTSRSFRPLSPDSEKYMEQLLRRLQAFYKRRGIFLRILCGDFDQHKLGLITESQFYRTFVQPTGITDEDVAKLVQKYRDPDKPPLINYLNLSTDLEALGEVMEEEKATYLPRIRDITDYLPHKIKGDTDLQQLLDRLRVAVFKNGIRTTDYFKDFDKLNHGIMSINQFMQALTMAMGKEAQLTPEEMNKLAMFYQCPDGRVEYKEFCDFLENAFMIPDLEKKPTQEVVRPPLGSLGRNLPVLMESEEAKIREILKEITDRVVQRRIQLYTFFKDYDRSMAYSRVCTPSQFGRVLSTLGINVSPEDFRCLCRKFADTTTGDINYPGFVQTVDKDFVNYVQETVKDYHKEKIPPEDCEIKAPVSVDFDSFMQKIRHHVLVNRLRVNEYFQDFDHLRTGKMTRDRFKRCLSTLGLSSLGKHNLTDPQFEALAEYYSDPEDRSKVMWTRFETDVESVFTIPNLEKMPTVQVPPSYIYEIPKPGTMDWRFASDEQRQRFNKIIGRLQAYVAERRAYIYPMFRSFDRHNNGHLSRLQFRQALSMAELHVSEEDMQTLEAKFANDDGINYFAFFAEVDPQEPPPFKYPERMKELRIINAKGRLPEINSKKDFDSLMLKIKTKIHKERVRVLEFMKDYDKLNSGRMKKSNFRRALDICHLAIQESELSILEDHYQSCDSDYVDYLRFSDDIEAIFATKHMEKMPTVDPHQFQPADQLKLNGLLPEHELLLHKCLERIAFQVKVKRMQLFTFFKDYDTVNNGCISKSQFRRVINTIGLGELVPTETEWNCLSNKFNMPIGGREDFNYVTFCDVVYGMAGFEFRRP